MRTKTLDFEGGYSLTIAPLSLKQVEKYIAATPDGKAEGKLVRDQVLQLICDALNNADPQNGDAQTIAWSVTRAENELDLFLVSKLQTEILEFSGLKSSAPGESEAAPKS